MLKGNRFLFYILLILLNIFIIYIIWKRVKYYEEEFTQMISVHNILDVPDQALYNLDVTSNDVTIDENTPIINNLNNFVGLFPVNDNTCVALDNKHQLYLITKDEQTSDFQLSEKMTINGIVTVEYPVKVVSYIDGVNYVLYLLTSYSKIYEYRSTNASNGFTYMELDNAIDICCTNVMIYLNNKGEIKNGTLTQVRDKSFVQIISYDNTSIASSKSLYGLCTDGHLYNIIDMSQKTSSPIAYLNAKLICNGNMIGYITNNNELYYTTVDGNTLLDGQKRTDVTDAIFVGDSIIYNKTNGNTYKYDTTSTNTEEQLQTANNIFTNNPLFTGVSLDSLFVMSTVSTVVQLPPPVVETPTEPIVSSCDITNDDPTCNEIFESLEAIIDGSGECDATQDTTQDNCKQRGEQCGHLPHGQMYSCCSGSCSQVTNQVWACQ